MGEASLTGRTLAGLKWAGLSAAGQALLTVSILAVLARLLTPEDFGLVAIAMIFVTAAHNLGHRNIGAAIVQRAELTERHIAAGVTLSIAAGAVFAGAVWALAPVAGRFFGEPAVAPISRALSVAVICTGFATVPEFLWRRDLRFRALTAAELVAQAFGYGAVAIAMALLGYGVWALVAGTVMRHAVFAAAVLAAGPRLPRPGLSRREAGELLGAVAGFSSVAAFNLIGNQGSRLVVARLLGATPLGYYTRATALSSLSGHLGRIVGKVLFPAMARRQRRTDRLGAAYLHGVEILSWLALPGGLLLAVCAGEVVAVVLGAQWTAAVPVLQILAIGTAFRIGAILNAPLARAMGVAEAAGVARGGERGAARGRGRGGQPMGVERRGGGGGRCAHRVVVDVDAVDGVAARARLGSDSAPPRAGAVGRGLGRASAVADGGAGPRRGVARGRGAGARADDAQLLERHAQTLAPNVDFRLSVLHELNEAF